MDVNLPGPDPADSENVVWLLTTAQRLWAKGERIEALRWVDRAANAARDEGHAERASRLVEEARGLALAVPVGAARTPTRKLLEQTMQSKPPGAGEDAKAAPVVVRVPERSPAAVAPVAEPAGLGGHPGEFPEVELSSSDFSIEEHPSATTRRFETPDTLAAMATPSHARPAPALPDDVLPAIRVWIIAGAVIPAVGGRPAGAIDAVLVSSAPGVDLVAALAGRA